MRRARLLAINPLARKTREFTLSAAELTIGSEKGNDLLLREQGVSRRHAVIRGREGGYVVQDLSSTNGTFVNERRVHDAVALKDGDHLRFGGARFVFLDPVPVPAAKRRLSFLHSIELLAILFAAGFGLSEYLLNRPSNNSTVKAVGRAPVAQPSAPAATPPAVARSEATTAASARSGAERTPGVEMPSPQPDWLARINYYRKLAGLSPAREDQRLSESDLKHAHYLMANYGEIIKTGGTFGAAGHEEEPDKKLYSEDGAAAARTSNLAWGCGRFNAAAEIDRFMEGPFHRLAVLNPDLDSAGFGEYGDSGCWAAGVRLPLQPTPPRPFEHPIEFPPDGATVGLRWGGGEWPNPPASCPGYAEPIGLPITIEVGRFVDTLLSAHSITEAGRAIEHCAFDARGYTNPDAFSQEYGREVLKGFSAIVLVPRRPLVPGKTYAVSVGARNQTYTWSFKLGARARGE